MIVIRDAATLRQQLHLLRSSGGQVAFVPTMGNLHDGHLKLVHHARAVANHVVVSIFVNPLQFGTGEDLDGYPRTIGADRELLDKLAVEILYLPDEADVYPGGMDSTTMVTVPGLNAILEGEHRPTHFDGVSTVVARLFGLVQPDVAVFGEKDYQQLLVIRKMVDDLCMPVRIDAIATVRETDGLAMSSRNSYLGDEERAAAAQLYRTLLDVKTVVEQGERDFSGVERAACLRLAEAGFVPDYVSIRRASDLAVPASDDHLLRALTAARLGAARLIDNIEISIS